MPYEVVAAIQKQTGELKSAIYDNGEQVIQAIVSAISSHGLALSDVISRIAQASHQQGYDPDVITQYVIDSINRQTRMGQSPLLS